MTSVRRQLLRVSHLDVWFLVVMTLAMILAFWRTQPRWLNDQTIQSIISQNAPLAVIAVAMTFAIISRHIDLSPGSMLAFVGVVVGVVYRDTGSLALGLLAGFGVALGAGVVNGLLVSGLGLSAIMVTLASYIWARGLALALTGGDPIPVEGGLPDVVNYQVGGFTITAPIVAIVLVAGWYLLGRTRMGRYTYAMGGDPAATRRAGVNVVLYTTLIFALTGLMVALASTIVVGQLASAQPYVGTGVELDAIIAVVIGGTRLAGGEGSIGRTALGVLFISILNSGLLNLGLTDAYYQLYKGLALLAVLAIQIWIRRLVSDEERRRQEQTAASFLSAA